MFKNIEKFHRWLEENSKAETNNMTEWEADLIIQTGATGAENYEMSSNETKSGRPETIYFDRKIITDADGEAEGEIIIF